MRKTAAKTPVKKVLTDEAVETSVPDLHDPTACKPELGGLQISHHALRMRSQRIFRKRSNGTLKVSQTVFDEWHGKGARRNMLEEIFLQCGYDPAARLYVFDRCMMW